MDAGATTSTEGGHAYRSRKKSAKFFSLLNSSPSMSNVKSAWEVEESFKKGIAGGEAVRQSVLVVGGGRRKTVDAVEKKNMVVLFES